MKRKFFTVLLIIFALVFIVSAVMLILYFADSNKQEKVYNELAVIVEQAREEAAAQRPKPQPGQTTETPVETLVTVTDPRTGQAIRVLPEYVELFTMNSDLVGWIQIPGTVVNYPVMQSPDRPNYYLKRNFHKESTSHGSIYAQEDCDVFTPSDNTTLYGHFMRDGSMFAPLASYKDKTFWKNHPYILFDTISEHHEYEIFAVFLTTASIGQGFAYNTFVDAWDQASFDEYVSRCKSLSLYDTGITPAYGDKLITLSTCEYSQTNGRLVVVARRIN